MKVAIIGSGSMGSIYGGVLAENGNEVYLIDVYQEHVDRINQDGLKIRKKDGERVIQNIRATSDPNTVGKVDLAIVFVKSTITDLALKSNEAVLDDHTIILTLQNGLGNVEKIASVVDKSQIIAGTTTHGANLLGPGVVDHAAIGMTTIGELDGTMTERIQTLGKVLDVTELGPLAISDNVMGLIWDKLMANVGLNPVTALTGLRNGYILDYPETVAILEGLVEEAARVASAEGVTLGYPDPVQHCKDVAEGTRENISSMLADINNRRRTEISNLNGAIARLGREHGIATPVNDTITNLIQMKEKLYQQQ